MEGACSLRIRAYVADELASEITDGTEDSARDDISFDARKPDLNLIEPTGVGRGVMDSHSGVRRKKLKDLLGFVGTEVIGDDVDLTFGGLTLYDLCQELDELLAGMPCGGFR